MTIRLFHEGDKSQAICPHCRKRVGTIFARRTVPFSDGRGTVKDLLVAVCDECDSVVATPAQSTPAIQDARKRAVKPIEAQLPAIYLDVLDLAAYEIDRHSTTAFRKVLMALYLHRYASGESPAEELREACLSSRRIYKEQRGAARRRLSLKVTLRTSQDLRQLAQDTGMSQSDVIRAVIFRIQADVLDAPRPALMRELKTLSLIAT
ncbi:hypothetical protein [Castellaniella sp.]|uniref:hypothetical protein n=1 Tax=Castellaniella sp. TaxID=1955812 RepID=UPI002AFF012C|nr:hypothetical protein [Castellaniella sp.]